MHEPAKTTQLNIRIDCDLRAELERLAREQDRPLAYLVRRALRDVAARQAGQQASEAA
jgi:predicted transcriptional regulator